MGIENRNHLGQVLNRFSKIVYEDQPDAIYGAWKVPLYVVSGKMIRRSDMTSVTDVFIDDPDVIINALVKRKNNKFLQYLEERGRTFVTVRKSANKYFIDRYVDV